MTGQIDTDDLTDEQIERVLNTRGFQKMLGYTRLADGIEVLEAEDEIFDSLVESIRKQHSNVNSEASVREFFELFVDEIETFTEPLVDADNPEQEVDLDDLHFSEDEESEAEREAATSKNI
jgi:hypothetical protein